MSKLLSVSKVDTVYQIDLKRITWLHGLLVFITHTHKHTHTIKLSDMCAQVLYVCCANMTGQLGFVLFTFLFIKPFYIRNQISHYDTTSHIDTL